MVRSLRALPLLAALAAWPAPAPCQQLDPERKVSVTVVAAPLRSALQELSKAAGYTFVPLKALENEVVSLRLKDATVREAMDRIAKAMRAEWRAEQGQHRLTVGSDLARRLAAEEAKAAVAEIRAALGTPGATPGEDEPASRLAATLDPSVLASLQPNQRVVFASSPNRLQLAMPRATLAAAEREIARAQRDNEARLRQQAEQGPPQGPPGMRPSTEPVVKALLDVAHLPMPQDRLLVLEFQALDAAGRVAWGAMRTSVVRTAFGAVAATLPDSARFEIPARAAELARMLAAVSSPDAASVQVARPEVSVAEGVAVSAVAVPGQLARSPGARLSDEWQQILTSPDTVEPHSLAAGPVLQAVAEAANVNLAAWLSDRAFSKFGDLQRVRSANEALRVAAESWGLSSELDGGWLVVGPARPLLARAERIDRRTLAAALRLHRSQAGLNLDQKAAYVRQMPNGGFPDGLDRAYENLLGISLPGHQEQEQTTSERAMLAFYSALGQANLRALASGRVLPLGSLGPSARSIATQAMLLAGRTGLRMRGGPPMLMGPMGQPDPTELLPEGMPPATPVALMVAQQPVAFGIDPNTGSKVALSAVELATLRNPALAQNVRRRFERFVLGTRSQLVFRFQPLPGVEFVRTLSDERPLPRAREMTLDELPPQVFQAGPEFASEDAAVGPPPPVRE
ncbi:MAG: hypothetical protein N2109_06590 [Fimbriimonadales bacterium]|nr:hypothetical protein [Fimbriimonadales bacterium]